MIIKILFTLCGLAVGALQYFMTSRITISFISKKTVKGIAFLCVKTAVYVAFFGAVVWFLEKGSLWLALGYGIGILCFAALNVLFTLKRNGRN